jgi:uncharacterized protein
MTVTTTLPCLLPRLPGCPDRTETIKVGEFVYYETQIGHETRRVLGRVTCRGPVRLLPDGFLADPDVPPGEIAAMIGYTEHGYELFEVTVGILGYYDETLGDFINPRLPPRAGTSIYVADNDMLTQVLSKRAVGEIGAAQSRFSRRYSQRGANSAWRWG